MPKNFVTILTATETEKSISNNIIDKLYSGRSFKGLDSTIVELPNVFVYVKQEVDPIHRTVAGLI